MILEALSISNEAIHRQENDKILKTMYGHIDRLRNLDRRSKLPYDDIRSNSDVADVLDDMQEALLDRFGLNIRLLGDNTPPSIYVSFLPVKNTHTDDIEYHIGEINAYSKHISEDLENIDLSDISTTRKDYDAIIKKMKKATDDYLDLFKNNKIHVDYKKAYISGVKDIPAFMHMPWKKYIKAGYTNEEILSVFMHEVGHAFNQISQADHMANTSTTMIDALVKNDTHKITETLDLDNIDEVSIMEFITERFNRTARERMIMTNNEMSADQFASRFGLGKDLAVMLDKEMVLVPLSIIIMVEILYTLRILSVLYITIFTIGLVSINAILVIATLIAIFRSIGSVERIIYFIKSYSKGKEYHDDDKTDIIYDEPFERFNKLVKELYRQIRTSTIPDGAIEKILSDVDDIKKIMSKYSNGSTVYDDLLRYIFVKDKHSVVNLMREIEERMETPLYADREKVKLLLKGK